jgi:hypothetical protein
MSLFDYARQYDANLSKVREEYESGDRNAIEFVLGTGAYGVGAPIADALSVPLSAAGTVASFFTPDFIEDPLKRGVSSVAGAVGDAYSTYVDPLVDEYIPEDVQRGIGEASMFLPYLNPARAATRGIYTTAGDVYKKGNYNPREIDVGLFESNRQTGKQYTETGRKGAKVRTPTAPREATLSRRLEQTLLDKYNPSDTVLNAYKYGKGWAKFGIDGLTRVGQLMFDPATRALYTNYGISKSYSDAYEKWKTAVENNDTKGARDALENAHQQMQQTATIQKQARFEAADTDKAQQFARAASEPGRPEGFFDPKDYGPDWYAKTASTPTNFPNWGDKDFKKIQDHFGAVWGGKKGLDWDNMNVLIKNPRGAITGDHFNDVLAKNTPMKLVSNQFLSRDEKGKPIDGTFRTFDSANDLEAALKTVETEHLYQRGPNKGKPMLDSAGRERRPPIKVLSKDDDGVWITITDRNATIGTAKVEGGVNMLVKVGLKGDLVGVMSDVHNYLEEINLGSAAKKLKVDKVPLVGKTLTEAAQGKVIRNRPMEKALPEDALGITSPMGTNVISINAEGKFGPQAERARIDYTETYPVPDKARQNVQENLTAVQDRVMDAGETRPTVGQIAREAPDSVANLLKTQDFFTGGEDYVSLDPDEELMGL